MTTEIGEEWIALELLMKSFATMCLDFSQFDFDIVIQFYTAPRHIVWKLNKMSYLIIIEGFSIQV